MATIVGCEAKNATPPQKLPPPKVTVATPVVQSVTNFWEATGSTEAVETVQLRARVNGYLKEIHFTDGSMVKKDQLLFTIEQEPFLTALAQARATQKKAEAAFALAEANLARSEILFKKNVSNQADLDLQVAERDQAKAEIDSTKAAVERAELDMNYTEIRSPIDGRVSRHMVDVGNLVQVESTLLTTVQSYDPIYAYFTVSEREMLEFREQWAKTHKTVAAVDEQAPMHVQMALLTEDNYPHPGTIDYSDPGVAASTGTYLVRARFPNANGLIVPGLFVRIIGTRGTVPEGLLVPEVAIGTDQQGKYLMTLDNENVIHRTTIGVGRKVGTLRLIEGGLTKETRLVINGLQRAIPGQPVTPELAKLEAPTDPIQFVDPAAKATATEEKTAAR